MEKTKNESLLRSKLCYTFGVLLVYMLGRRITLYGADLSAYRYAAVNADQLLSQTIGGDIRKVSVFALGISPYMIASILVVIVRAIRMIGAKSRSSMKRTNQWILYLTLVFAMLQGLSFVENMHFRPGMEHLLLAKIAVFTELMAGVMLIYWLCIRNKRFGVGGQSALIFVNILEGMMVTLWEHSLSELLLPLALGLVSMLVIILMERAEFRIPVQRISIYSIYADQNYQAFKLNPVGAMPVMFATAVFSLLQLLATLLQYLLRDVVDLEWLVDAMVLQKPQGVVVYLAVIYGLNLALTLITINPSDMAEQFLKNGDSICNLYSGRQTKRYLTWVLICLSMFSATVMGICVGVPLLLQLRGNLDVTLVMFPASMMMLTGVCMNLNAELETLKSFDSYQTFL